jgi:predicted transposase YbfD/YdcC
MLLEQQQRKALMVKRKPGDTKFAELIQDIDLDRFRDTVLSNFIDFEDPRIPQRCLYPPAYLFLLILCGYLSGCNTVSDLTHFGELRAPWLSSLLGREFTPPSHNTLWWFLSRIKPSTFKTLIFRWLRGLPQELKDQLLVIDGKRLRGVSDNEHICHIVELFAAESSLVIAQEKVPDKACESGALPALLDAIDVKGAIISMDAHYAHIPAISEVLKRDADYLIGIKGNQPTLEWEAKNYFDQVRDINYEGVEITRLEGHEKGHGRIESRLITVTNDLERLPQRDKWHLQSLIEVRSERSSNRKIESSVRCYGSSRKGGAKEFAKWIRNHFYIFLNTLLSFFQPSRLSRGTYATTPRKIVIVLESLIV